jgi:hypothetical protein
MCFGTHLKGPYFRSSIVYFQWAHKLLNTPFEYNPFNHSCTGKLHIHTYSPYTYVLWHVDRPIARKQVDKHISVDIDSWKVTHYGTHFHGYEWSTNISLDTDMLYKRPSGQNWGSRSSDQNRERPEWSQSWSSQIGANLGQLFIVSYCNWLWLWKRMWKKVLINPIIHPKPVISHTAINIWQYIQTYTQIKFQKLLFCNHRRWKHVNQS